MRSCEGSWGSKLHVTVSTEKRSRPKTVPPRIAPASSGVWRRAHSPNETASDGRSGSDNG